VDVPSKPSTSLSMCQQFQVDTTFREDMSFTPSSVFEHGRGDGRAFNAGFVYALRASGIPARLNLGTCFKFTEPEGYSTWAVQSELYVDGVGWLPCDCSPQSPGGSDWPWCESTELPCFVSWHALGCSRAEARECSEVMRAASADLHGALARIHQVCERKGLKPGEVLSVKELSSLLGAALNLPSDAATRRVEQVLAFRAECGGEGAVADCLAAMELGQCPADFAAGIGPHAAGGSGLVLFEGGPYEDGVPLDIEALKETRLITSSQDRMDGEEQSSRDVGELKLSCDFTFSELPVD